MVQNRNKLIGLFISNIANAIVHRILERAIDNDNIRDHYDKELKASFNKAKIYREKINPVNKTLPDKDTSYVKNKIIRKVKAELELRISKGYENIDLELVDSLVKDSLKEMNVE